MAVLSIRKTYAKVFADGRGALDAREKTSYTLIAAEPALIGLLSCRKVPSRKFTREVTEPPGGNAGSKPRPLRPLPCDAPHRASRKLPLAWLRDVFVPPTMLDQVGAVELIVLSAA